ncbi:MAG: hypothetical protein KAR83_00310 [Thermodesulfovibrionales bacterium]|nr:hypothetical protein [Thermodesulfovibrionales bacterium]
MITGLAVLAAVVALMTHAAIHRHTAERAVPQAAGNVVRVCAYCNMIMGAHPDTLNGYRLSKETGHAPSGPGLVITHGMCQSCFDVQMRELDNE